MKTIIISGLVAVTIWFLFWKIPVIGIHIETGQGQQTGFVSAVETSGIFWKTSTVYIKPTLESTQEDVYCVMDKNLVEILKQKSQDKENITVKHITYLYPGAKHCNNEPAIIVKI